MRNDNLRMAFSSQSSWLEKWFFKPNALAINVLSCFYIVDCIDNKIKSSPEVIIKNDFILLANS